MSGAGEGKLARLLAVRGGHAAPEAPFVIEHREALIYMLCEAAELEHGIMCQYLFAAFSLKEGSDDLTAVQHEAVARWQAVILRIAAEEMMLVTTLPVGPSHPGRTTGPSFELFYESDYLLPHRRAAWTLIRERLQEAVLFCERIHGDARVNASTATVGAALNRFAKRLVLEEGTP
jgi:hypothetical protein